MLTPSVPSWGYIFLFICMLSSFELHTGNLCRYIVETLDFVILICRVIIFVLAGSSITGGSPSICAELVLCLVSTYHCKAHISGKLTPSPWNLQDSDSKTVSLLEILSRLLNVFFLLLFIFWIQILCSSDVL